MTHLLMSYQNINAKNVIPPPYRNFVVHSIFIEKQYPKWFLTLDVMQLAKTVYHRRIRGDVYISYSGFKIRIT